MQISSAPMPEEGRHYHVIGRIRASSCWRGTSTSNREWDRLETLRALIREAEAYEADAIVEFGFEVDSTAALDFGGVLLQRLAATGIAVKFDLAA